MRSSIGVTKILTFYFILLYLFLKAKMCVGSVRTASTSISDSDINYYDNDESFQAAPAAASAPLDTAPSSAGLVNHSAKNNRHHHASTTPRAHHVRHEHHYVKNRHITQAEQALRAYKSNFKPVDSRADSHRYTTTSHHRPHHHRQRVHHRGSKNIFRQQNHGKSRHNFNSLGSSSFAVSPIDGQKTTRLNRSNLSNSASSINQNTARSGHWTSGQQKSFPSATSAPAVRLATTSINHNGSLSNYKTSSSSLHSKNYFEELLNSYKTHSPYYKDQHQKDSSQLTKSLTKEKCSGRKCKHKQIKAEVEEYEDDYEDDEDDDDDDDEDDDDDDEDYDNAETQGDAGYSTTVSPVTNVAEGSKNHTQYSRNKLSHSKNTNYNSLHHSKDDSTPYSFVQRKSDSTESVTEGKKFQKELFSSDATRMASYHAAKMRREGTCAVPKPKIILASNDPSKTYTPHCTILHRCGDDVGCCLPTQTCSVSKNSTVELYFFVQTVGSRSSIERLSFVNHTECACTSRRESFHWTLPATSAAPPIKPACTCPSLFQRVIDNDNHCFCDCSSSDTQCDQFKRGLEHFSMENRRCIKDGRCEEPVCEYGYYHKAKGKCPTREDKLSIAYKG